VPFTGWFVKVALTVVITGYSIPVPFSLPLPPNQVYSKNFVQFLQEFASSSSSFNINYPASS
jgi:hypothetical protein